MKKNGSLKLLLNNFYELGESPLWDHINQEILWVDIFNHSIYSFCPGTDVFQSFQLHNKISAIALSESKSLIATLPDGFYRVDIGAKTAELIHDFGHNPDGFRYNDGKCDPLGRFWVGNMQEGENRNQGKLYIIDADLNATVKLNELCIPNGLAWSPDHSVFYFIDTCAKNIVAYDFDLLSGNIFNKRIVVTINEPDVYPDGLTIDRDGMLWVALWDGGKVVRYHPQTGEELFIIHLPVSRPTSCVFGGEYLNELYITTAKIGLTESELKEQPLAGGVFVFRGIQQKGFETFLCAI